MNAKKICKIFGIAIPAFGIGILSSFFLPDEVLIVMESIVIISVGALYFFQK